MLIHNYGHGGAGMSLSWGTGQMAAELALEHSERTAAVVGCGVAGLTTARQLQRRGFEVTIYAMSVPPNTTSNMSLASWTPTSGLVDSARRTAAWDAQFRRSARIAYRELQLLVGRGYGVSWLEGYSLRNSPPGTGGSGGLEREPLLPEELRPGSVTLGPGEHPFPTAYAIMRPSLRIEPSIYLDRRPSIWIASCPTCVRRAPQSSFVHSLPFAIWVR
jgi:glycine/D-amino acid oxidase-like deaminating enzyme